MTANQIPIPTTETDQRLDKVLQRLAPGSTYAEVNRWCRTGQVRLDGRRVKGNERVKEGQMLRVPPHALSKKQEEEKGRLTLSQRQRTDIEGWILAKTNDFVVINKPPGIPTQAGTGHKRSVDRLLSAFYADEGGEGPKLTHRLDKHTSGCLLLARSAVAARALTAAFKNHEIEKVYWSVVRGCPQKEEGVIDAPLKKSGEADRAKVRVSPTGQAAMTHYKVLAQAGEYALVEARPKTGRMHQIRVHLAHLKCPIVGDFKYGGMESKALTKGRFALHAQEVSFVWNKQKKVFKAPLPKDFKALLDELELV